MIYVLDSKSLSHPKRVFKFPKAGILRGTQGFSTEIHERLFMATQTQAGSPPKNLALEGLAGDELMGSDILVKALIEEKVQHIWGYPGGAVLYLYDALYRQDKIQHVLVRHEQAAVHAADGYARATGEVGVALVTSGPGVTNAITGIATAYMDSIPMVIITGNVPTHAIGLDAF